VIHRIAIARGMQDADAQEFIEPELHRKSPNRCHLRPVVKRFFDDFLFSRANAAAKKIHNDEVVL
jgi:hypothetical protein